MLACCDLPQALALCSTPDGITGKIAYGLPTEIVDEGECSTPDGITGKIASLGFPVAGRSVVLNA